MSLKLEVRHEGEISVIHLRGRLTLGEAAIEFRRALQEEVRLGYKKIVLQLDELTYMDSSGLGGFISAFTTAANAGGDVVLASLNQRIRRILQAQKLYTVFDVYDTLEQAIRHFKQEDATEAG